MKTEVVFQAEAMRKLDIRRHPAHAVGEQHAGRPGNAAADGEEEGEEGRVTTAEKKGAAASKEE